MKSKEAKPTLYMLIGIPGSGKSTWLSKQNLTNSVVVSTDNYIESYAKNKGLTYNDVFKSQIKNATTKMNLDAKHAFDAGKDVYWDQTNLTPKSRANKLEKVPEGYKKVAIIFPIPDDKELKRRLTKRPGKKIPDFVMKNMINNFIAPSYDEDFDELVTVT